MDRCYSTIEIKSFDEEKRTFEGVASTPTADRTEDVVNPLGGEFKLPLAMMWQHGKGVIKDPVGWITHAAPNKEGIPVRGQIAIPKDDYPQPLKDELNGVWVKVRDKIVRGLSLGFRPLETEPIKGSYGVYFKRWEWLELSPVGIAANAEASIISIKSIDQQLRANGDSRPKSVRLEKLPAAAGNNSKGTDVKTYTEQIKDLEATRAAKAAARATIMQKALDEGRSTEDAEGDEIDTISVDLKRIDKDLVRLRDMEAEMFAQAKAVDGKSTEDASGSRGPMILKRSRDKEETFKGQNYVRMLIAKAVGRMEDCSPISVAIHRWGKTNPTLVEIMKANEVPGGGSGSGEWGAELVTANTRYTGDFIEYLYSMTVYDKLPLRVVPANVMIKGQDGQGTGYWVGESKPIPATTLDFMNVSLTPLKVGALCVVSNEWIRDSDPSGELLVRDGLVQASSQRVDTTFLSATAASAGVSPAGILNGLSAGTASGVDAAALRNDIKALYAGFITAKNSTGLWLVMTPALAKTIQMMVNALGQTEFPGISTAGGQLLGDPVVVGDNVGTGDLILLKPSDIYRIGDTGVQVSLSREAMIEQSTVPTGATDTPVAASQAFTSMFQEESTAFKVVRSISFAKRRSSAVAFIGNADYGSSDSP